MYVHNGARKIFMLLLITTVENADRIEEPTLAYDIKFRCVAPQDSLSDVSCDHGFIISVINAHYVYYASNRNARDSCSRESNTCLVSVPLNSSSYYAEILDGCNGKESCNPNLKAAEFNGGTSCGLSTANDYVSIQFYCLPSRVSLNMKTASICIKTSSYGTISCNENRVIQLVGAILGFQPHTELSCKYGEDRCRIQPDLDHFNCLRSSCQGQKECQFYAATSISRTNHPCDLLDYMYAFENVSYYCTPDSGTQVSRSSECGPTSSAPSTVPVTSIAYDSVSASDASTYTMVDNLGNVSTTATDTPSTDITGIIVGCVVGGVILIILLLLLIFIVRRRRNSEDASKRRGNNSATGVNGLTPNGVTTMVKCDTPQGMTHSDKEYDATSLSDNSSIPTYSLGNHPATALYDLAQDLPQPPVYWLAQEPSIPADTLAREPLADFYSEVEDLAEEPYLSLYSNSGFSKEIGKSNAGIYVNVTEPSNAAYSLVQKTNSSTHQKVEDPVGSASTPVNKFKFTKVKVDKEEEKVSALTRHQSVQRPEDDLVLRENSLYVATETHTPNDAVDELTLTENDLYV